MNHRFTRLCLTGITTLMTLGQTMPAFAAEQTQASMQTSEASRMMAPTVSGKWKLENGDWYFYNGNVRKSGWVQDSGKWYYLQPGSGKMAEGWLKEGSSWYYLQPGNGQMKTGWVQDHGTWYYLQPGSGKMQTGWKTIGGKTYYLQPGSGAMRTGWVQKNGKWYFHDLQSGHRKTGWVYDKGLWYYLDKDGCMLANTWIEDAARNKKYYVDGSGKMTKETSLTGGSSGTTTGSGSGITGKPSSGNTTSSNGSTTGGKPGTSQNGSGQSGTSGTQTKPNTGNTGASSGTSGTQTKPDTGNAGASTGSGSGSQTKPDTGSTGSAGGSSSGTQTKPDTGNTGTSSGNTSGTQTKPGTGGSSTAPEQPETPETPQAPADPKRTQYSYEVYTLNDQLYSGQSTAIYVRTDNPDGSGYDTQAEKFTDTRIALYAVNENGDRPASVVTNPKNLNIHLKEDYGNALTHALKVEGGYMFIASFSKPGSYKVAIQETINGKTKETEILGTMQVLDTAAAEAAWMDEVIARYTTPEMSCWEKMGRVSDGLLGEFKYLKKRPNGSAVTYVQDLGKPYFVVKEWDSMISPAKLCEFARKIGGFERIHNCFNDYPRGTEGWKMTHWYVELSIGESTTRYEACPLSTTNIIEEVEYFDFSNTSQMYLVH